MMVKFILDPDALIGKTIKTASYIDERGGVAIVLEDDSVAILHVDQPDLGSFDIVFGDEFSLESMKLCGFITSAEYDIMVVEDDRLRALRCDAHELAEFKRLRMKFEQKHIYGAESLTSRKERGNTNES